MSSITQSISWSELSEPLNGRVITPTDAGYDEARHVWNGMIDLHPAAIARCRNEDDVRTAIAFARRHDLPLSIRGGGHSAAGLAIVDAGLVVDLTPMNDVAVDPAARTARAGGGATWADFDRATTAHNLATTGGAISTTGIGGLTLGGGIGNLMRAHGLSCDNLLQARVVLATGEVVTANKDSHADLYWALKGGGGNFGVVTEFTYQLHPMTGMVGGLIIHPRDNARAVLQRYREVALAAPDELGLFCGLIHSPEGAPIAVFLPWFDGNESAAAPVLAPLREFGEPIADLTAPVDYVTVQTYLDEAFPAGMQVYWKSHFLTGLPDEAIDIMIEYANSAPSVLSAALLETMGGAIGRIDPNATAFAHRDAPFNLAIIGRWLDPAETEVNVAWARAFFEAMQPFASGAYVNYLGVGDDPARIADAYAGPTYQRLRQVKRQYDPENLFRRNQNILPA